MAKAELAHIRSFCPSCRSGISSDCPEKLTLAFQMKKALLKVYGRESWL